MKARTIGRVYQRQIKDKATGKPRVLPTWWLAYSHNGRRIRESSRSTVRKVAEGLLKRRLGESGLGTHAGRDAERITIKDLRQLLLNHYEAAGKRPSTIVRAKQAFVHVLEHFGDGAPAFRIGWAELEEYVVARKGTGAATIRAELSMLRASFGVAIKARRLTYCPVFPMPQTPAPRQGFLREENVRAICAHLEKDDRGDMVPLVWALWYTGWRFSELAGLRWADVSFQDETIQLTAERSKTGEARRFPFSQQPQLKALLLRQKAITGERQAATATISRWVFPSSYNGEPISHPHAAWARACKAASVPGKLIHDMRRSMARRLIESGVPEAHAMLLLGHRSLGTFRRYLISDMNDLGAAVARLARFDGANDTLGAHSDPQVVKSQRMGKICGFTRAPSF